MLNDAKLRSVFRGRNRTQRPHEVDALQQEIDRLSQENMRLRLERQRPLSVGKIADDIRELTSASAQAEALAETHDDAQHVMAQAKAIRYAVLDLVQNLQIAAAQLERQLVTETSLMEVDRRVVSSRRHR